ncbi:unnamed protein product, partial [Pylaiella littoralis]
GESSVLCFSAEIEARGMKPVSREGITCLYGTTKLRIPRPSPLPAAINVIHRHCNKEVFRSSIPRNSRVELTEVFCLHHDALFYVHENFLFCCCHFLNRRHIL